MRGSSSFSKEAWLTSDSIHVGVLLLRKEFQEELGSTAFVLPPLQWDFDSSVGDPLHDGCKKKAGSNNVEKNEGEHFLNILKRQGEDLVTAPAAVLERAVIYTVVNRGGNHWLGLEACVRTRCVLVYDPADTLGARPGCGSEKYFGRLQTLVL